MMQRNPACVRILENLERVIYGKSDTLGLLLVALLAEGHLLLEDVPGVGKTTLARALARSLELEFKRIQFTPDLMPADIVGSSLLRPAEGTFTFQPGPVFTHVLLADEINRASPRTQSALLEAMSERQVTTDGVTRPLARPFFVLATQNPIEAHGTYPLPEAQLDRFFMRLRLGYPAEAQELDMLYGQQTQHPLESLTPVASADALRDLQAAARAVTVERSVARYVVRLAQATREHPDLALGASPRGTLALFHGAQALAFLAGRTYSTPDDVQRLAEPVLAHRLELRPQARYAGRTPAQVLDEIVGRVPVPT
ncbi:MoxR family ATPase [Myxococcota bacterium]|nr:MoxR family ATPase [Myxococcota bacterium]